MAMFFFYNNKKPRKFNHIPITYDPVKEERERRLSNRIAEIKREMGKLPEEEQNDYAHKDYKSQFVSGTKHLKRRKEREGGEKTPFYTNNNSLLILLVILILVAMLLLGILP